MSVAGILSGLFASDSVGYTLARTAIRTQPTQPAAPREDHAGPIEHARGVVPPWEVHKDVVEISEAARRASETTAPAQRADATRIGQRAELTEEEQQRVEELKRQDEAIRQHEQAHLSAAGAYARGGASFEYETGPDGKRYAVAGEVQIDTTPIHGDPEATIRKMEVVRQAALAPAEPSATDRQVAARATQAINEARAELAQSGAGERVAASSASGAADEAAGPEAETQAAKQAPGRQYSPRGDVARREVEPALLDTYA